MRNWAIFAIAAVWATPSLAQAPAATLPGGASSLQETYDAWRVVCVQQATAPHCSVTQQQTQQNGQQVLMLELFTDAESNQLKGTLVLPFGLALANGVRLREGDKELGGKFAFSTCVPVGCLVPMAFDTAALARLRKGESLKVSASVSDSGQPVDLSISLKGFAQAHDRISLVAKGQ
ncbi:hypothetical protein BTE77_35505 [Ensifer adhaerens]|nr:hypothetical protein BTE77_35505 [Ensifer adhaerens]